MPAGYSFRPRLWALALAAAGCAAFISLGMWQTRRAEEKRALGARLENVSVAGTFLAKYTVLLDNKLRGGKAGYEVVTPLKPAGAAAPILVNRGWIEAPRTRERLPEPRTPQGEVRIGGWKVERLPHALEMGGGAAGKVRQNLDLKAFSQETGLAVQPFFILQREGPDDGLARDWPRPDAGVQMHQSYAVQWYAFAALAVILAIVFSFRKIDAPSK
jgi:surfeit locus 1 family protein